MRLRLLWPILSLALLLAVLAPPAAAADSRWRLDLESGAAFNGMNDIAIPGDTGTRFSLTESFGGTDVELLRRGGSSCGSS